MWQCTRVNGLGSLRAALMALCGHTDVPAVWRSCLQLKHTGAKAKYGTPDARARSSKSADVYMNPEFATKAFMGAA